MTPVQRDIDSFILDTPPTSDHSVIPATSPSALFATCSSFFHFLAFVFAFFTTFVLSSTYLFIYFIDFLSGNEHNNKTNHGEQETIALLDSPRPLFLLLLVLFLRFLLLHSFILLSHCLPVLPAEFLMHR